MASSNDLQLAELRRFLYLGDEFEQFPKSVHYPFSPEKLQRIRDLELSGLVEEVLKEVETAYSKNNYLGIETLMHVLSVLGQSPDTKIRSLALKKAATICTSAASVLTFTHIHKEASKPAKGWGRAIRTFLKAFYDDKDAKDLAIEVTKVKSRYNWSHKDVLCMSHIKASKPGNAAVFKYLMRGLEVAQKDCGSDPEAEPILSYLKDAHEVSHEADPETAARLIEMRDLCLEQISPKLLKFKEVVLCLITRLPLQDLLTLLPRFNKSGLLKPSTPTFCAVLERLNSPDVLANSNLNPLQTFLALRRWQISNKIGLGKTMAVQNNAVDDALQNIHQASFKILPPSTKRFLVALDTNLTMNHSKCSGCSALTPSHASDVALLSLVKAENSSVSTLVFSGPEEVVPVDITDAMTLGEVVDHLNGVQSGPAILSAPINWALTKKMQFDAFIIFTTCLSHTLDNDLANVFKEYRETMHLPNTRFILCSFCDRQSSFPHEDPSYLNIVGFNVHLLKVIQDFTCGVF